MAGAGPWATVCTAYGHVPSRGAQGPGRKGERSGSCAQPVSPWRADRPWPYGNDAPIGRPEGGGRGSCRGTNDLVWIPAGERDVRAGGGRRGAPAGRRVGG